MFRRNQIVEKITLLEEIWKNNNRKLKLQKKLKKEDSQAWKDDGIVYIKEKVYVSLPL